MWSVCVSIRFVYVLKKRVYYAIYVRILINIRIFGVNALTQDEERTKKYTFIYKRIRVQYKHLRAIRTIRWYTNEYEHIRTIQARWVFKCRRNKEGWLPYSFSLIGIEPRSRQINQAIKHPTNPSFTDSTAAQHCPHWLGGPGRTWP